MEEMPLSEGPPPSEPYPVPPAKAASAPSSDQEADFPQLGCPKCNEGHIVEGRKGFGCNRFREGCNFVVWKTVASKELTREQVETLIRDGKTDVIGGFKSRKGTTFETRLRLDEEWKTVFDFN
jgi:DNA topoisomerase-3